MKTYLTFLDKKTDADSPMIGTILYNSLNVEEFKIKLIDMLGEHYDIDDVHWESLPDFDNFEVIWDFKVTVGEGQYRLEILRTWMY